MCISITGLPRGDDPCFRIFRVSGITLTTTIIGEIVEAIEREISHTITVAWMGDYSEVYSDILAVSFSRGLVRGPQMYLVDALRPYSKDGEVTFEEEKAA